MDIRLAQAVFKRYLASEEYKPETRSVYERKAELFCDYLKSRGMRDLREVTPETLEEYHEFLLTQVSCRGHAFAEHTIAIRILVVKLLLGTLYQEGKLLTNPAEDFRVHEKRENVRPIFTVEEMAAFLETFDGNDRISLRNRALFEMFYSTGLRLSEARNLKQGDVGLEDGYLMIRHGKFDKDRVVPLNDTAIYWMKVYGGGWSPYFFSGKRVDKIPVKDIRKAFSLALEKIGLEREGLCIHSIRHSCATHLLENGASVRYVQELLGHKSIETTVKYTHLLPESMKRTYRQYHPRENLLFEEIDREYLQRIQLLKKRIMKAKRKSKSLRE